jgi:hypothetical protein
MEIEILFKEVEYETSIDEYFVASNYYDASEFIKLLFDREAGNTFDGINASTTLEELSQHPIYGANVNARERYYADYRQQIQITKDISIGNVKFRFDSKPIYTSVTTYNSWGYYSGAVKEYDFTATPDAIVYELVLYNKAGEKRSVVVNALKTEIERRYGQKMKSMNDVYCLLQDNGKFSFAIVNGMDEGDPFTTLIVAFSKKYLSAQYQEKSLKNLEDLE